MIWMRRQTAPAGHSIPLLFSVLALLALLCFPIVAQADSSGVQYETALPNAEGGGGRSHNEQIAESSKSPEGTGGATAPSGSGGEEAGSGSGSSMAEGPSSGSGSKAGGGGGNGGTQQGSPQPGANKKHAAAVNPASPTASNAPSPSSGGGGSSPLVPILIVLGVLAAISLGAFLLRQRRSRDTSPPLSTKAG
jgi:MYXO-CTERM domain-containing protein